MSNTHLPSLDPVQLALDYHERTKHHYQRFAASLGYLDWDTQPDPFRHFEGASFFKLPFSQRDETPPYDQMFEPKGRVPAPLSLESVSAFFFYSMALSAWKSYGGSQWALRVNPSSGNLHPTEGYGLFSSMKGLHYKPAGYHYSPLRHGLEMRTEFGSDLWRQFIMGLPQESFLIALSSIHWRESWKYGERAYRYCQHDVGHALAALTFAAAIQGWTLHVVENIGDDEIAALLGLDRLEDFHANESESPDLLAVVYPATGSPVYDYSPLPECIQQIARGTWRGKANRLSGEHHPWSIIERVSMACLARRKSIPHIQPAVERLPESSAPFCLSQHQDTSATSGHLIRTRRSAVAMDGKTTLSREAFYSMLARTVPTLCKVPWNSMPWRPLVHLGLFVHRVEGIPGGLYALVRQSGTRDLLQEKMNSAFLWNRPEGCPEELPLFLLAEGDCRRLATSVSCGQDIAGDGVFSCGMLALFEPTIRKHGAFWYRRLFWETGMIGQVLYLEAEAKGIRGTGIGCFFDDPVHEIFGLKDRTFQSLYHFTAGGYVDDPRLTTLPAYEDFVATVD